MAILIEVFFKGVQNVKNFYMKFSSIFFPLHFSSGATTKNFSHLTHVECPPLGVPIIKGLHQSEIHEK